MKICFIGDSSSIHLQRIVSHYLHKKDNLLVLSSAKDRSDIPGARTVYLLNINKFSTEIPSEEYESKIGFARYVKSFFPSSWKAFIKFTITCLSLLSKRRLCIEEIQRFNPDVI